MKLNNSIKSIAIGSFDGIHIAHQALIEQAQAVVVIERNSGYLTPGCKRTMCLAKPCYFYHLEKVKSLTPSAFVEKLTKDFPALEQIIIGYDFHFGKNKEGDVHSLIELFDGEVVVVPEVSVDGIAVHSRTIKAYIREGNIPMANKLLGKKYRIQGEIIRGQGLGKKELVPTINLKVKHYQLPLEGIYATRTLIDGIWLDSVSFFGHRVTTDGSYAVETHILDRDIPDIQGMVWIEFIDFIRQNQKFETLSQLKKQIELDCEECKKILSQ